ncbi:MAG: metallophosphoesterase [Deltaproteobacteria bacterium]|nr:metallophosphoesterase [Deltaproteobacteria bacterium]
MRKVKIIVSDFHIGKGVFLPNGTRNPLEDFFYDTKFIEFLQYHRAGEYENADVELICNGDFFNHLQLDYYERHPEWISEKVALSRTDAILKGHPEVFAEMKRFAETPNHRILFMLGNHDPGLLFPSIAERLRKAFGTNVSVRTTPYRFDGVHVEHGNQFFADNAYNTERLFLKRDLPEPIVNLPWGSYFVIHYLNEVRRERPYFHKVYPFKYYLRWALIHDTVFALKSIFRILFYFCRLRFTKDPHRRSSFVRTIQIIKEVGLSPRLDLEAKKILLTEREAHVVIFGHSHHAVMRQFAPGKVYLNTGVWNEQLSLEMSDPGKVVRLTYGQLDYDEHGVPHPSLKEWKGSHRIIEEVIG